MNPKPFLINCTTFDQTFCTIFVSVVVQVVQVVRIGTELQYCTNCTILYLQMTVTRSASGPGRRPRVAALARVQWPRQCIEPLAAP